MDRPPIKQAMIQVMGTDTCSATAVFERLAAKGWLPAANNPRTYVGYMLSSQKSTFERAPERGRGYYRVKEPLALHESHPWVEVSRRRLTGYVRVGEKGAYVRVFWEVVERRVVDGKTEERRDTVSRIVHTNEIVPSVLAEIVGRILPDIEDAAFAKVEDELKLCFDGDDLVPDLARSTPLAEALLGQDPF